MTTCTLAHYLFTRLKQLNVHSIHGVPGDYNLTLLDHIAPTGLLWVGSANELNAGYAADGYARIKGLGALITTFGVGELSAINAIAGSFVERAAVIHIVGTPPRETQDRQLMVHHTLGDGNYRHFQQMAAHVTAAQVNLLDARTAPEMIDAALREAWLQSRPVYIELPADMVGALVGAGRLETVKVDAEVDLPDPRREEVVTEILSKMCAAQRPMILVDGEIRPLGITRHVQELVDNLQWPTLTTPAGQGLINMQQPNVHGIYKGNWADPSTKDFVAQTDLVLRFGPHSSSINTYNWSAVPEQAKTIDFTWSRVEMFGQHRAQVSIKQTLSLLLKLLPKANISKLDPSSTLTLTNGIKTPTQSNSTNENDNSTKNNPILQNTLWPLLTPFLRPTDILLAETGTAAYGARELLLPTSTRLLAPITWLSIGYMLPAAQGAALAQRELSQSSPPKPLNSTSPLPPRTILIIGDGSLQLTIQELSTILYHRLPMIIFILNNDGYTIERCIHGKSQAYNTVPRWNWLLAPEFFSAADSAVEKVGGKQDEVKQKTYAKRVTTHAELAQVLNDKNLIDGDGLRIVEITLGREDVLPGPLMDLLKKQD